MSNHTFVEISSYTLIYNQHSANILKYLFQIAQELIKSQNTPESQVLSATLIKSPEQLSEQQPDMGLYSGALPLIHAILLMQQFKKLINPR